MNLGVMKDWLVRTTKRPDKRDDQIQDAVNAAIEYATTQGDFAADLIEGSIALDSALYAQNLVISTTMPRFRKVKYLRPSGYRRYLKWKDPSKIFSDPSRDYAGTLVSNEALDVWYRAGDNLVFKLSVLQTTMLYGYYTYPTFLTTDTDTHWMLDQMRTCMHDLACWRIFEQIGNESEATRFATIGGRELSAHKSDLQDSVSHS